MSSSIARRREAKAARRKKLLADRRKRAGADSAASLPGRLQRLARAPIHCCVMHKGLFETGTATLILARGAPATGLIMASFLLDAFCLGVKDAFLREIEASDLEEAIEAMEIAAPVAEMEPAYARKLLREAVAYARALGFDPPREYGTAKLLFGDVSADACEVEFQFGQEGRPVYIPGSSDTPAQTRQRLDQLRRAVGENGFDFFDEGDEVSGGDDEEDEDLSLSEENEWLAGYDPAVAPDPDEWFKMDEDERILRIKYYHQCAGLYSPDDVLHAIVHLLIENQVAHDKEPVVAQALARLQAEGLDRHEAIHAIGSLAASSFNEAIRRDDPSSFDDYLVKVEQLNSEGWRRSIEEAEGEA
jgi:hypothetical protein